MTAVVIDKIFDAFATAAVHDVRAARGRAEYSRMAKRLGADGTDPDAPVQVGYVALRTLLYSIPHITGRNAIAAMAGLTLLQDLGKAIIGQATDKAAARLLAQTASECKARAFA